MCVSREKTTFRRFVVNDAYIQKALMIDTVHDHECLIFLFGFKVQFVSNLTYLYGYILAVWWYVLRMDFMCTKSNFYICVMNIASIISL